jgi:hypothetical protein
MANRKRAGGLFLDEQAIPTTPELAITNLATGRTAHQFISTLRMKRVAS